MIEGVTPVNKPRLGSDPGCCVHCVGLPSQSTGDSAASAVLPRVLQANMQGQGEGVARGFNLKTSGGCVPSHSLLSSGFTSRLSSVSICFEILSSLRDGTLQAICPPAYLHSLQKSAAKVGVPGDPLGFKIRLSQNQNTNKAKNL